MTASLSKQRISNEVLSRAWIGDAVLSLWARLRILKEDGQLDGEKCIRMTSNQFLSTIKEPSELEAEIGKLYQHSGLDAAFALIERSVLPAFERQEKNRRKRNPVKPGTG
jgi:dsRNA-specific ribonuclease